MAYTCLKSGLYDSIAFNAANEVAVDLFLKRKISFVDIFVLVESVMDRHELVTDPNLDHVLQADKGCDFDFLVGRSGSAVPARKGF